MRHGLSRRHLAVGVVLVVSSLPLHPFMVARAAPEQSQSLVNLADFDFVVAKIRENYAGYDTKITDANRAEFAALTSRIRSQAASADNSRMEALLKEWIGFFHDGHTNVIALAPPSAPGVRAAYPSLDWTERDARTRLAALGAKRDPVEGIWRISGDRYRVAVLRTGAAPVHFAAVVLTTTASGWAPGQVKADITRAADGSLSAIYRDGDHDENNVGPELIAGGIALKLSEWGNWEREWPAPADPDAFARAVPAPDLFLKRVSQKTLWLRVPDFHDERAAALRKLLEDHAAEIASTPNLIVDVRENGGGSDYVYEPLLPLLYTQPVYSIGIEMRASTDNIALRHDVAEKIRPDAPKVADEIEAQNRMMAQHLGGYIRPDPLPFTIDRRDRVLPFPKRVAVLIDGAGSTGEQFLLDARQSHKVTLMGQHNSAGVLDFANVVAMPVPSGRFRVQWATSRSLRLPGDPVDPDGIAPSLRMAASERDAVTYAKNWLERQAD